MDGAEHGQPAAEIERIEQAIMQISWLGQRQFMQLLDDERFRLTLPQFYTLLHLQQSNAASTMTDLADLTHQSAASLTGVVDRLLEKELVERTRHDKDRRQVMVEATHRGRALIAAIKHARREQMRAALGNLGEADLDTLQRLLDHVLDGMLRVLDWGDRRWA
ncbi:MAG: MarR family transcriptional regulator [Chloroflexales bacterium]|nr:MarR family transcriptional regulator [Chloroflexales bacterium]